jgi:hypothetical protein
MRNHMCILLSARSQSEKTTHCMIPVVWDLKISKTTEIAKKKSGCQGWGGGYEKADHRGFLKQW